MTAHSDPAPTETAGQAVGLTAIGTTRAGMLMTLKRLGEATADQLAEQLGLTVAAVRQRLGPLVGEGLVAHRDERTGRGRPRRWYRLAPAAESLFPKRYGQLANQLLGVIGDADPSLVEDAFTRRAEEREAQAVRRLKGLDRDAAIAELARILDEDGYLANWEKTAEGSWRISELNCAILDVARQHGIACASELSFIRAVLPWARVERVSHLLSGGHSCSYEIREKRRVRKAPTPPQLG
ncbi:MAG: ArsR family transcriptional regulator [Acidimicrobiaceae bacterium]|nr:ArsR family transcriptional regulator [Acidimicrobiaceae bacterium]